MQAQSGRPLRVFICHAVQDNVAATTLFQWLNNDGIDVWFDLVSLLPGDDIGLATSIAIKNSDIALICLSKLSLISSGRFNKEIKEALALADEKPENVVFIVPVQFEECDVPNQISRFTPVLLDFNGRTFTYWGYSKLLETLKRKAIEVNAICLPKERTIELPLDFLFLLQSERVIVEICSYLRVIDSVLLKEILIEVDTEKYRVFDEIKLKTFLKSLEEKGLLMADGDKFLLPSELRLQLRYYLDNDKDLAKKINMAAFTFYQNMLKRSVDNRSSLIVEELYYSVVLDKLGVDIDIFDVLNKRLEPYTAINTRVDNWQDVIQQISDTIRNDGDLRELAGEDSFDLFTELVNSKINTSDVKSDFRFAIGDLGS